MSFNCLLTTLGQAKIAAAIANGTTVSATHIAIGDGNGNATTPAVSQTALVREVYRTTVSSISVNPSNSSQVIFEGVIASNVGGWTARELGLFDGSGDLIAVANIGSVYKPLVSEGSAREMVVRIYAQVDQVGAINLVVDPSFYIATRSWVNANFSLGALLPGGTTGQILRKKSNADGDTEWVNPLSAQNVTVDVVTEVQTLAASQTIVNLAVANTSGTAIYIEGVRLRPNQYTVNSNTQLTLAQSYPAGSKLLAAQNDPNASLDFLRKGNNLSEITSQSAARTNLGLGSMAVETAANYVAKSGGTMTGDLNLPGVSKTANGYSKLPNGMIMQWGFNSNAYSMTTTFPIAFPTACLSVSLTLSTAVNTTQNGVAITDAIYSKSTTNFVTQGIGWNSASVDGVYWLAIGY